MKISFVIPAYNEEHYIGECVSSIIQQLKSKDYEAEVIVVNNASTDKTRTIASSFPGVIILDETIKGTASARNAGFKIAQGDLIANIDADTILPKNWLKKVVAEFEKNPKLVALSGPYRFYDVSKKLSLYVRLYYYIAFLIYLLNRYVLNSGSMLQAGNMVFKKTALIEAGGYDLSYSFYGDDVDLARRLHKVGNVAFKLSIFTYSSGRRVIKEGLVTMAFRYTLNYIWVLAFKKPFTKTSLDVRLPVAKNETLPYPKEHLKKELAILASIASLVLAFTIIAYLLIFHSQMIFAFFSLNFKQ